MTFSVGTSDEDVAPQIDRLFQDLPLAEVGGEQIEGFAILGSGAPGHRTYALTGPGVGSVSGLGLATVLAQLVTAVNLASLAAEPERLHVHAGAVVRDGRAALMVAERETGKTTTLARLVLRGWEYLSDEAVSIGVDDDEVRGFSKPLSIKPLGRARVPELAAQMIPPLANVRDNDIVHVPLGSLGVITRESADPALVVLLRRLAEGAPGEAASSPLHPVDAVVGMMAETMDAARFGAGAVAELARLAVRCGCHEVLVGDADATADVIERLFDEPAPTPVPVRALGRGGLIEPDVASLLIGDRVVAHRLPHGSIVALDPIAAQIWMVLGGWTTHDHIDLHGPVVAPFVEQLVTLGLVDPSWADGRTAGGAP